MRILGFSRKWQKLTDDILFTTFRYPRRDKDWQVEEVVQVVYKPRTKGRVILGIARIIRKQKKNTKKGWCYYPSLGFPTTPDMITPQEAYEDGFSGMHGGGDVQKLLQWLRESNPDRYFREPIVNKLTLYWITKFER